MFVCVLFSELFESLLCQKSNKMFVVYRNFVDWSIANIFLKICMLSPLLIFFKLRRRWTAQNSRNPKLMLPSLRHTHLLFSSVSKHHKFLLLLLSLIDVSGCASQSVAAHFSETAIPIEDRHFVGGLLDFRDYQNSICTNSEMELAEFLNNGYDDWHFLLAKGVSMGP